MGKKAIAVLGFMTLVSACSESDDGDAADGGAQPQAEGGADAAVSQLCADVRAKVDDCNIFVNTEEFCLDAEPGAAVECAGQCLLDAACGQLAAVPAGNPYFECRDACGGG